MALFNKWTLHMGSGVWINSIASRRGVEKWFFDLSRITLSMEKKRIAYSHRGWRPSLGELAAPIAIFSESLPTPGHLKSGPLVAVALLSSPARWSASHEPGVHTWIDLCRCAGQRSRARRSSGSSIATLTFWIYIFKQSLKHISVCIPPETRWRRQGLLSHCESYSFPLNTQVLSNILFLTQSYAQKINCNGITSIII